MWLQYNTHNKPHHSTQQTIADITVLVQRKTQPKSPSNSKSVGIVNIITSTVGQLYKEYKY